MSTKNNQTKRRLPIYVVLAGLLLGGVGTLLTVDAYTQDENLGRLAEKLTEHMEQFDHCDFSDITPEMEERLESLGKQYDAVLQEYGLNPNPTDAQLAEMNKRLSPLDKEYEEIVSKLDGELTESEAAELEQRLDTLDAELVSVLAEFGIVGPQLTEAQFAELDKKLDSLYEQFEATFADSVYCS